MSIEDVLRYHFVLEEKINFSSPTVLLELLHGGSGGCRGGVA